MWIVLLSCAYRPANVLLPARATREDVTQSIVKFTSRVEDSTAEYIFRRDLVTTSGDDIVFDALSGSRSGRVPRPRAVELLHMYAADEGAFDKGLLQAQMTVVLSQTMYLLCQLVGVAVVFRIILDIVEKIWTSKLNFEVERETEKLLSVNFIR